MIVLITNQRDLTTDYIIRELKRRELPFARLNTEALGEANVRMRPECPEHDSLEIEGQTIHLANVTAAYFRRPEPPIPMSGVQAPADRTYCAAEWSALLKTIIGRLSGRWFNDPTAIIQAEDKPRQLIEARGLKMKVPETLITNDPAHARAFVAKYPAIVKPLRQALLDDEGPGKVVFTTRVGASGLAGTDDALRAAPFILQAEVIKQYDVRVTVVDDQVFAASIQSQDHGDTETDWRRGVRPDLEHRVEDLPLALAEQCVSLTRSLGLRYGAIDFVRDRGGEYWFLEINPNGQWAWIEERTGLPIASAIVDVLSSNRD